jgi:FkbM family methyltransferase
LSRTQPYTRPIFGRIGNNTILKPAVEHDEFIKYFNYRNGFFLECGGHDGYGNDPTYYLEKVLGWKGIIAEPLPIFKLCKKNRKKSTVYNCAIGSFEQGNTTISFNHCDCMSFVSGSIDNPEEWVSGAERAQNIKSKIIEVPIRPFQELIDDYFSLHGSRKIDLLVVDTEGSELAVLQGIDFSKNSPEYVMVEAHTLERKEAIEKYLQKKKYALLAEFSDHDFLFKVTAS